MKISRETAEHYQWGESCDGWKLADEPDRSIIHERMPPGTTEARHYHEKAKQFFFLLSGTAAMYVKGEKIELRPNEGISIEAGIVHQMTNESDCDTEFLVISQPATKGDRIVC